MKPPADVYTVGHSTRTADEFLELLDDRGIQLLVDVRRFPVSRRHPQFGRGALESALRACGIGYRHEEVLGGRRGGGRIASGNDGWRNAAFRAYADHAATPEFQQALDRIGASGEQSRTALMCAEAVPWRCHRQIIADHLVARGHRVLHILSPRQLQEHRLNALARPAPEGGLRYPACGSAQSELF